MGYYSGDYYRGDYYRGDPGVFSAVGHVVGGALAGVIRGGPVGGIVGAVGGAAKAVTGGLRKATLEAGGGGVDITRLHAHHRAALMRHKRLQVAATAQALGGGKEGLELAQKMHRVRRKPRMNPYNPRALRRAVRRARSFAKMALKVIRLTQPKRLKGRHFAGFKHRKRAA